MSPVVGKYVQCFRQGLTQSRLCDHKRWLEARNIVLRKKRDCTILVAKTKAPIFAFVFAYAKNRFSHKVPPIKGNI